MITKLFWILKSFFASWRYGQFLFPSYLINPLFIRSPEKIFIGKKVRIYPNARLEINDKSASIIFEDDISAGQNLHIISGKQELRIGRSTTISANVFISNIEHTYQQIDIHVMYQPIKYSKTNIGENCFIGYGAVIQAGTILGRQCIVGANSVVRGVFPDYSVIVGVPAKIVKRYDATSKQWRKTNAVGDFIDEV